MIFFTYNMRVLKIFCNIWYLGFSWVYQYTFIFVISALHPLVCLFWGTHSCNVVKEKKKTKGAGGIEFSLCKPGLLLHHYCKLYVDVIIVYGDVKLYPNQYIMLDAVMVCSWFNTEEKIHDRTLCRLMWPYRKLNLDDIFLSFFTIIIRILVYFLGLYFLINNSLFSMLPISGIWLLFLLCLNEEIKPTSCRGVET